MIIETKYNINEEVFFMQNNKIFKGIIMHLEIYIFEDKEVIENGKPVSLTFNNITYKIKYAEDKAILITEKYVFKTKEELLRSL